MAVADHSTLAPQVQWLLRTLNDGPLGLLACSTSSESPARILAANRTLREQLGYAEHELATLTVGELTHPADRTATDALCQTSCRLLRKDGTHMWVAAAASLVEEPGYPPVMVYQLTDLTAERLADERLHAARENFKTVFEHAPVGMALCSPDGVFLQVNRALCAFAGRAADELLDNDFSLIVHPDDLPARCDGTLVAQGDVRRYARPDGAVVHGELHRAAVPGESGATEYYIVQLEDVTERWRAERAREQAARLHQTLASNIPETTVGIFDEDLRWLIVEGDEVLTRLGTSKEAVQGKLLGHVAAGTRGQLEPAFRQALAGQPATLEWDHPQGRAFELQCVPVRDTDGSVFAGMAVFTDITDRKQAERQLQSSEGRHRALTSNMSDTALLLFNSELRFEAVEGAEKLLRRLPPSALEGRTPQELLAVGEVSDEFCEAVCEHGRAALTGEERKFDYSPAAEPELTLQVTVAPVRDDSSKVIGGLMVAHDVSVHRRAERRLRTLAEYDALTGLPNREQFNRRLAEVAATVRAGAASAALFLLDLDSFKEVNDTLGHDAGDELLQEVAGRLSDAVRASDLVCRLSGDEFTVILEDVDIPEEVAAIADRVLRALRRPVTVSGQALYPTASLGVALLRGSDVHASELVKSADMAMYAAKADGGDSYRFFASEMAEKAMRRLRVTSELRQALTRGELTLHYQPQMCMATGQVLSAEALVRWQHPTRGLLGPAEFVTIAEQSGLIVQLGEFVLDEACRTMAAWRREGSALGRVAVNVSVHQLTQPGFSELVRSRLSAHDLRPEMLELEITESSLMDASGSGGRVLDELKRLGVLLTIDDFGTGYSSLARLKRFPLDVLKIDRAFVSGVPASSDDEAIVRAVIALAKTLNLTVLAEGVETEQQRQFLLDEGCDMCSGWLFAPALPADKLAAFAAARG